MTKHSADCMIKAEGLCCIKAGALYYNQLNKLDVDKEKEDTKMNTVILYNIISLIIIFVLIFALRIVSKSGLRKNKLLLIIIKVIVTILIVCVIAFILFIDAIAFGIIGLVPS